MKSFKEGMREAEGRSGSRVVLALDLWGPYESRLARAKSVLEATAGRVAGVKVNFHLLLPFGLEGISEVISTCRESGVPLIADLKMNDIEATNLNATESLLHYGFDAVIANPFVGYDEGLDEVAKLLHSRGGGLVLLVYMSHKGAKEGFGLTVGGRPLYLEFARRARDWGADGVVVSAMALDKISETRAVVGKDCLVFSPGAGVQGGDARSWRMSGADYLIVGRSITEAPDPGKAIEEFNERLGGGMEGARTGDLRRHSTPR